MKTLIFALAAAAWLTAAPARADTANCIEIVSVPVEITVQGVHCLKTNIQANLADGPAILVAANNVTIDLNGFKLGNLAAGNQTAAVGIATLERKNVIIQNGSIRGFAIGIMLLGDPYGPSFGHRIERMSLDNNLFTGIFAIGGGIVIRDNQIANTANAMLNQSLAKKSLRAPTMRNLRSKFAAQAVDFAAVGILGVLSNSVIENNTITRVISQGEAGGIIVSQSSNVAISGNFVSGIRAATYASGIMSGLDNRNIVISGNTILDGETSGSDTAYGIENLSEAVCLNNTILSFTTGQTCYCTAEAGTFPVNVWDGRSGGRVRALR